MSIQRGKCNSDAERERLRLIRDTNITMVWDISAYNTLYLSPYTELLSMHRCKSLKRKSLVEEPDWLIDSPDLTSTEPQRDL